MRMRRTDADADERTDGRRTRTKRGFRFDVTDIMYEKHIPARAPYPCFCYRPARLR